MRTTRYALSHPGDHPLTITASLNRRGEPVCPDCGRGSQPVRAVVGESCSVCRRRTSRFHEHGWTPSTTDTLSIIKESRDER